jgi:DNA-binding NtrC family response regulator
MSNKVLVVDDEAPVRDLLKDFLKKEDYQPTGCGSGEEALAILEKETFDVVLLDIKLTGISGLDVLKIVKEKYPKLPVVMITGFGFDEELIVKSKQLGCCGFIGKNMSMTKIIGTFNQFVKKAQELRSS